jgi:hypothetical protein
MKKSLIILTLLLVGLCPSCFPQPTPQISNVVWQHDETWFSVSWETDIPTTSEVILCDESAGLCQWYGSSDCDYGHDFSVKLDPTKEYHVTIVASRCGKESIFEIPVPPIMTR